MDPARPWALRPVVGSRIWLIGSLVKVDLKFGCRLAALCWAESPLGPLRVVTLWSWD